MNVKRFTARTSKDAFKQVRIAFGPDAVVLSTKPCADGVEVLAMAPDALRQFEKVAVAPPVPALPTHAAAGDHEALRPGEPPRRPSLPAPEGRREPSFGAGTDGSVEDDVKRLSMSTLSFQEYVRERMLRRRQAEREQAEGASVAVKPGEALASRSKAGAADAAEPVRTANRRVDADSARALRAATQGRTTQAPTKPAHSPDILPAAAADPQADAALRRERTEMMTELRSMKGLIEERFGALAFMEKLQREPRQAELSRRLLECGFSPALVRKLVAGLPAGVDESTWAAGVLARNLATGEREAPLEDVGGVFAMIGSTGVGKTTSTAKLAAAFAARHGASQLGLITLDAYRMGAQEQLRAYGRILGVPVHTAHDRSSLEDLLDLLSGKRMVLIDTAGIAQRDARTADMLEMLSHPSIQRVLVVNASSQGETIDDVIHAWQAARCRGVVLTKVDEAVKLAPALDPLIRHRLKVLAVANGQRVPEDWHRLSAATLVQRALKPSGTSAWRIDPAEVNLVFAGANTGVEVHQLDGARA
jgi:flagellar biosynthesis protein FlhF